VERAEPLPGTAPGLKSTPAPAIVERAAASLAAKGIVDPTRAPEVVVTVAAELEMFSGPLPPPNLLAEYDAAGPGNATRVIAMAEREQRHRHRREALELAYPYLGLLLGFAGFAGCVGGAVYLAVHGAPVIAGLLVGASALGAVSWFIRARLTQTVPAQPPPSPPVGKRRR